VQGSFVEQFMLLFDFSFNCGVLFLVLLLSFYLFVCFCLFTCSSRIRFFFFALVCCLNPFFHAFCSVPLPCCALVLCFYCFQKLFAIFPSEVVEIHCCLCASSPVGCLLFLLVYAVFISVLFFSLLFSFLIVSN